MSHFTTRPPVSPMGAIGAIAIVLAVGLGSPATAADPTPTTTAPNETPAASQSPTGLTTQTPLVSVSPSASLTPTATPANGPFVIVIPPTVLQFPLTARPGANNLAESYHLLNAYVEGQKCISVDLVRGKELDGSVVLRLGMSGQPEVCSKEGETVTLRAVPDREIDLVHTPITIKRGGSIVVTQLDVAPPHTGDTGIAPPATGDGAFARIEPPTSHDNVWSRGRLVVVGILLLVTVGVAAASRKLGSDRSKEA